MNPTVEKAIIISWILVVIFLSIAAVVFVNSVLGQENDTEGLEDVEFCSGHLSWLDREFCEQLSAPQPP